MSRQEIRSFSTVLLLVLIYTHACSAKVLLESLCLQEVHDFCGQLLSRGFHEVTGDYGSPRYNFEEADLMSWERAAEARAGGKADLAAAFELLCDRQTGYCP